MAVTALVANYVNYGNGSSTGHYAVTAWAAATSKTVGNLIRQSAAPTVGNERIFICVVAGTTHATTEPTWTVTRGALNTDNTVTWQECTGQPAVNGDLTNTKTWTVTKTEVSSAVSLGVTIKDASNNLFICTTAGTMAAGEPTWNTTIGVTTADNTATWTCIANGAMTAWGAPHARLSNAFASTWGAAGDTFYVSDNHAATRSTSATYTAPGTAASPNLILCVDDSAAPPTALATTATDTTTGNTTISFPGGTAYYYGVSFSAGSGASGATAISISGATTTDYLKFDQCSFALPSTSASGTQYIWIGSPQGDNASSLTELCNCNITFGAIQTLAIDVRGGKAIFTNVTTCPTGSIPTTLIAFGGAGGGGNPATAKAIGCNFSTSGSGKNILRVSDNTACDFLAFDCKLGASVTLTTGSVAAQGGCTAKFVNCWSADANYYYTYQDYQGTITQETTIVRTGGASDGVTSFSRKMVSSANSKFYSPLKDNQWFKWWNSTTGSAVTVAIEVVTDNVTLTDAEAWVEVEYLGTSGFPLGSFADDRASNILATPANQTTSSETWTTTGLTTPVKQTLSKQVTPQEVGWIRCRVNLAKASTTLYACPKVLSTSAYQYMDDGGDIVNVPASGGGGIMLNPGMLGGLRG